MMAGIRVALGLVILGLVTGLVSAPLWLAQADAVGPAVLASVMFGGLMTAFLAILVAWTVLLRPTQWGKGLAVGDRLTVFDVVRTGREGQEVRLAPAVIEYAAVMRQNAERMSKPHPIIIVATLLLTIAALADTLEGDTGSAAARWWLVAWSGASIVMLPRLQARRRSRAEAATAYAHRLLADGFRGSTEVTP